MGSLQLLVGEVDLDAGEIRRHDGSAVALTPTETKLVAYLTARPNQHIEREELLEHVWGYADTTDTRAVYYAMRRLRGKAERDPGQPDHFTTMWGTGYRFVPIESWTKTSPGYYGRSELIAELRGRVQTGQVVWISGAGGMGKSRLVREVFRGEGGNVVTVELEGVRTKLAATERLERALGTQQEHRATLEETLRDAGVTLVFDAVEALDEDAHNALIVWLEVAEGGAVTSRRQPATGLSDVHHVLLQGLVPEAAAALFVQRAEMAGVQLQPDNPTIGALVERLDYHPLSIELAAARMTLCTPGEALELLDRRFRLLRAGRRTLHGTLDWSWELLSPEERQSIGDLSVFRGWFTFAAASKVCGLGHEELRRLEAWSLLQSRDGEWRLLESIRAYAQERLEPARAQRLRQQHRSLGSSRVDLQACKLEYSIVSPK